tara:strand:+ start:924 stop:1049 length:126 start_codon:yes stop_codon:yes gene_type:complete
MEQPKEDSHSSCDSLELNMDSDEEDWFNPEVPMEMKLQAFM